MIIEAIVICVGWTVWFYWAQGIWNDMSSSNSCTEGRNLWDFINTILIMGLTAWVAVPMSIVFCVGICCLPCIASEIK